MAKIKFFRAETFPTTVTPQEGYVWFNPADTTIRLYKSGNWEYYSGVKSASYANNILTITPSKGNAITIDLSILKSTSDLTGLIQRVATLETNYNTLSGKVNNIEGTVNTTSTAVAKVIKQLKNIQDAEGAVKTYVDEQIAAEKLARENADSGFTSQISGLTTTTNDNTSAVSDLKTFVAFAGGVNVPTQITNAINALDNGANGVSDTGEKVTVTVKQENGKVTSVTVAEQDIASAQALANLTTTVNTTLTNAINTEKGRVDKLVGSDANKSVRTIAAEETAKIVDGADSSYDTLKEIALWIAAHPDSVAALNKAIGDNTTAITAVNTRIDNLDYTDTAVAKQYVSEVDQTNGVISVKRANLLDVCDEKGAAGSALTSAKAYTDTLANGQVKTNTTAIATNTGDITTIKGQITAINTTIEENELTVASALTDLDARVDVLETGTIKSVSGQSYITATTTDGAVIVKATTGAVANNSNALAVASDVKTYVDSTWEWASF